MSKDLGPASRTLDSEEDTPSKKEEASETK
jgi:hypothetical protein